MAKKHKGGDHGDIHADERWLITYADMITLLLAVFIVMYALSDTNLRKFNAFAQSLSAVFNTDVLAGQTQYTVTEGQATTPDAGHSEPAIGYLGTDPETLRATIKNLVIQKGLETDVSVTVLPNGLSIHFASNLLFEPGRAALSPDSTAFLTSIADMVKAGSTRVPSAVIRVEGNTDSTPVSGPYYADNWELSAARALTVLHFLADYGVDGSRLVMAGNGANQPMASLAPEDARNRRVEISLIVPAPAPAATAPVESIAPSFNPVFGE